MLYTVHGLLHARLWSCPVPIAVPSSLPNAWLWSCLVPIPSGSYLYTENCCHSAYCAVCPILCHSVWVPFKIGKSASARWRSGVVYGTKNSTSQVMKQPWWYHNRVTIDSANNCLPKLVCNTYVYQIAMQVAKDNFAHGQLLTIYSTRTNDKRLATDNLAVVQKSLQSAVLEDYLHHFHLVEESCSRLRHLTGTGRHQMDVKCMLNASWKYTQCTYSTRRNIHIHTCTHTSRTVAINWEGPGT